MDQKEQQKERGKVLRLILYGFVLFLTSLWPGKKEAKSDREDSADTAPDSEGELKRLILRGWLIICGMSVAFALYGVFAFLVIGDKGPPDWDFGGVQDIPGGSEYSTYPFRGAAVEPEPQHVNQKPSDAIVDILGPPPTAGKLFEGSEHEGPRGGVMRGEYGPGT